MTISLVYFKELLINYTVCREYFWFWSVLYVLGTSMFSATSFHSSSLATTSTLSHVDLSQSGFLARTAFMSSKLFMFARPDERVTWTYRTEQTTAAKLPSNGRTAPLLASPRPATKHGGDCLSRFGAAAAPPLLSPVAFSVSECQS